VNSEELEQSLRSEFETYLKSALTDVRRESEEFQQRIEAEFDRQKAQFADAFREFSARFDAPPQFDEAFSSSLSEHLRLARDEGAKIAATAMAEAEKLSEQTAAVELKYDAIRDAVNDISTKDTQSAILKSLVQHAETFAPRGAFFIIKNEHFAGWKVFGAGEQADDAIREVHFPASQDTILGKAVSSLSSVTSRGGEYANDNAFLSPLGFDQPRQMVALPLVARGRGVAVLYVDEGSSEVEINRDALETLVRVAGLTVELLASMQTAHEENRTVAAADFENARHDEEPQAPAYGGGFETFTPPAVPAAPASPETGGFSFTESMPYDATPGEAPQTSGFIEPAPEFGAPQQDAFQSADEAPFGGRQQTAQESPFSDRQQTAFEPAYEDPIVQEFDQPVDTSYQEPADTSYQAPAAESAMDAPVEVDYGFATPEPEQETTDFSGAAAEYTPTPSAEDRSSEFSFDSHRAAEPVPASSPFDRAVEEYSPAGAGGTSFDRTPEPVAAPPVVPAPAVSQPAPRLSDRNVDLPIDVPEEERRLHNDARRFARLLVSEIKLYNEKKVTEGRQAHDLYDRLREAIDRSREMYDKRVQPPVAAKFDYFHYELTNSLAEGDVARLGAGYPGASV
jgi:hypothetical protein